MARALSRDSSDPREEQIRETGGRLYHSEEEHGQGGHRHGSRIAHGFGEDGFEKMVDKVTNIEKTLGIYELAQFTPKI